MQGRKNKNRNRRIATEFSEDVDHLCVELESILPIPMKFKDNLEKEIHNEDAALFTNFNNTVFNAYAFILLHLRNKSHKNVLNIHIPETCIFIDRVPFDIVYESNGYIRGTRTPQQVRLSLKQLHRVLKQSWVSKNLPKNEQCLAAFAQNEKLMLSDNDLYLVCCKNKIDPYFKKLRYIKNKIPENNNKPLICQYPPLPLPLQQGQLQPRQINYVKAATQGLLGFKQEQQFIEQFSQEQVYLNYLNQKIVLFLNYQQNIRIKSAKFSYIKTNANEYYLWDVSELKFDNLTKALLEREKMLKKKEEERQKILILSPEKQAKYKKYFTDHSTEIKSYEQIMTNHFNSIVQRLNLNTMSDNRREQVKNELAFKRLHPRSKFTYNQIVTSEKFMQTKNKLFNISTRKQLTVPSKHVMRYYNQVKNPRVKTETIDVWKSKFL